MASTYTDRLGLEKQGDGENPNSWGTILNTNVIDLIDDAIAGYEVVSVSSTGITLTNNNGSIDQSRNAALEFAGTLTANVTITIPSEEKTYFIRENTTGSFAVQMKTAVGSAITLAQQSNVFVACDGTDIYSIESPTSVSAFTANSFTATSVSTAVIIADTSAVLEKALINTTLSVTGNTALTGTLTVGGITKLNSIVSVNGAAIGNLVSANSSVTDKTINLSQGNFFKVVLQTNTSLTTPSNMVAGQSGIIYLIQDAIGGRTVNFSSVWKFPAGVTVTPTSAANAVDLLSYFVRTSTAIDVAGSLNFTTS